ILSVFGQGIGSDPTASEVDPNGRLQTEIGGTQLLIDGKPAPLLYTSSTQVNAIMPYYSGDTQTAMLQITYNGLPSSTWELPVASSSPALFTLDSSGVGQ